MSWFVRILFAAICGSALWRAWITHQASPEAGAAWIAVAFVSAMGLVYEWATAQDRKRLAQTRAALMAQAKAIQGLGRDLAEIGGLVARASRVADEVSEALS